MGADDEAAVDEFLDRRIENVMQFEKFKAQAKDALAKMPDPWGLFGQRKQGVSRQQRLIEAPDRSAAMQ